MFNNIKVIEFYYPADPRFKEIMYDDAGIDVQLHANHISFIRDVRDMFKRRNYLEDINIEKYKSEDWNFDLEYKNPKDINDAYKLRFEISDNILPFQEHDPFRYISENMYDIHDDWWMFMINVNNILCYTLSQAFNVIQVLTGMIDRP